MARNKARTEYTFEVFYYQDNGRMRHPPDQPNIADLIEGDSALPSDASISSGAALPE
jgi:hypothetical protein